MFAPSGGTQQGFKARARGASTQKSGARTEATSGGILVPHMLRTSILSSPQAKNLGNYHPLLKRMYSSSASAVPKRKRERGLRMGVGKFEGGTLKLNRQEIDSVTMGGKRTRGRNVKDRRS